MLLRVTYHCIPFICYLSILYYVLLYITSHCYLLVIVVIVLLTYYLSSHCYLLMIVTYLSSFTVVILSTHAYWVYLLLLGFINTTLLADSNPRTHYCKLTLARVTYA